MNFLSVYVTINMYIYTIYLKVGVLYDFVIRNIYSFSLLKLFNGKFAKVVSTLYC